MKKQNQFTSVINFYIKTGDAKGQDIAAKIVKPNGKTISAQYLSDLRRGQRNAPDHIVEQLINVLGIESPDSLWYTLGRIPPDLRDRACPSFSTNKALADFRIAIEQVRKVELS